MCGKKIFKGRSSSTGQITAFRKGGGVKKLFMNTETPFTKNISVLLTTCYDPNKSAFVALCYNFLTAKHFNMTCPKNLVPGSLLHSLDIFEYSKKGCFFPLKDVIGGLLVYNLFYKEKPKYIKAAGGFGIIMQKKNGVCKIKLPSGKIKDFKESSFCFVGSVSNTFNNRKVIGKAGRSRLNGIRPTVRGVAMNPIDHPHGGKTAGGCTWVTPWGIPTKGHPTAKKKYVKI